MKAVREHGKEEGKSQKIEFEGRVERYAGIHYNDAKTIINGDIIVVGVNLEEGECYRVTLEPMHPTPPKNKLMHQFKDGELAMITATDHHACGKVVTIERENWNMGGTYWVTENMGGFTRRFLVHGMDLSKVKISHDNQS